MNTLHFTSIGASGPQRKHERPAGRSRPKAGQRQRAGPSCRSLPGSRALAVAGARRRPGASRQRGRLPVPARADQATDARAALLRRPLLSPATVLLLLRVRSASASGVGTKQERSTKAQSLRPAANAIDATSRLLDTSPVADTQAADRRRARVEGPEGHALGVVGLPDGFMRRVGAAARDEGVVAGRGGRAARARAGRPLAARPRARLRPVGAARRARACPRPWVLVASLSYRRRCAPASTTAASPSSWRSGSGEAPASPVCSMVTPHRSRRASLLPRVFHGALLDGRGRPPPRHRRDASPVASRAGSTARRTGSTPC